MTLSHPLTPLRSVLLLFLPLALAGCWEVHQRVSVNPDGSARVEVSREISLDVVQQMGMGEDADLDDAARQQAAKMVRNAQGVEAWSDMDWSVEDGVIRVTGTAYVPDLDAFALSDPSGDDGSALSTLDFRRTDAGSIIEMTLGDDTEDEDPLPSLTREAAMEMAAEIKKESRQMRTMAAGMFIDMRESVTLELPSEPTEVEGFAVGDDGAYTARFEGEKLLAAIGEVVAMETEDLATYLQEAASRGESREEAMGQLMLDGMEGIPARVVIPASGEPRFDYGAEAEAAAETYPELKERLGITGDEAAGGDEPPVTEAAPGIERADEAGGEAEARAEAAAEADAGADARAEAGAAAAPESASGPGEVIRLEVGRSGALSSLESGTTFVLTLPALAGADHLGLATAEPEGLTITDDEGRDLLAASREAYRNWEEANPNTMTSRTALSWSLGSTRGDPQVPTLEIELWAIPSAGARTLHVRGEVPILRQPTTTETATVPPGEIADGGELFLGDHRVRLSRYASMSRGDETSVIYDVEGDVIVTAVRRGGELLWDLGGGADTRVTVPEELPGTEPVELTYGEPSVRRVPVDLRFGLGLDRLDDGGDSQP